MAQDDKTITYLVNGEPCVTSKHKLTARELLANAGFFPVEDYVVTRDNGHQKIESLDEEIPIHKDRKFTVLYKGITPTS